MSFKSTVTVIVVCLLLIVAFQNRHDIVLGLLFWDVTAPQLVIIMGTFLTGFGLGALMMKGSGKSIKKEEEAQEEV